MKIRPALFRENESPGAVEAGNKAWRQVATGTPEALNTGVHLALSGTCGAPSSEEGMSSFTVFGHRSGLCFMWYRWKRKGQFRAPAIGQAVSQVTETHVLSCFNPGNNSPGWV